MHFSNHGISLHFYNEFDIKLVELLRSKKDPIYHKGKFGPHYHPNDPKYMHRHYYFGILCHYVFIESDDEYDE